MFGKKVKVESNANDRRIMAKNDDCWSCWRTIDELSAKVYVLTQTVNLYAPKTADREAEEKALADARYSLLCAIGNYDTMTAEYKRMLADIPSEQRETTCGYHYNWPDSHEIIRRNIKNFLTK